MDVIRTESLSKSFGTLKAVDSVSISVRRNEVYGFLGLNGAGKTTTIRLLLGMIKPDSGNVTVTGKNVNDGPALWNEVGYLVESPHAYPDLTVKENLDLFCRLRSLEKNSIDTIIETLNLSAYRDRKAKHLSTGNAQRLGLAKAMIHKPKILILDEPVNGLDPAGIVEIREYLKDLVMNHDATIFISSHILSEISKLATRIGIIHKGKLLKEINSAELGDQIIKKLLVKTVNDSRASELLNEKRISHLHQLNGGIEIRDPEYINSPDKMAALLVNASVPPRMLSVAEEDLEEYFLRVIGQGAEK